MGSALKDLFFPVQYLEIGAGVVRASGGDVDGFYRFFGLGAADLSMPGTRVSAELIQQALSNYVENSAPGLAPSLQFMRHFPVTAHGPLGMLMLTNKDLGGALEACLRYYPLLAPVFTLRRQDVGDRVHIILERLYELGRINEFLTELTLMSMLKLLPFLVRQPTAVELHFSHAPIGNPLGYGQEFAAAFHFNATQTRLVLAREDLAIPLMAHSPTSSEQFRRQLDQQSREEPDSKPTTQHARRLLRRAIEQRKSLTADQLAEQLFMSTRTLSRRLNEEGTTVPALEQAVRLEYAQLLLLDSRKSIAEISHQVGFADTASFSRAFKRLTGKTPREFRG